MMDANRSDGGLGDLVIPDAVGEWWIHPLATFLPAPRPRTVMGAIGSYGRVLVCEIDHRTGAIQCNEIAEAGADDHNVPAVWTEPGRRPLVAWTNHNADNVLRLKVGDPDGELGTIAGGPELTVDIGGKASYSQIYRIAHLSGDTQDTFWVFARRANTTWIIQPLTVDQPSGTVHVHASVALLDARGRQAYITTADAMETEGNQTIRLAWGYNPAQPVHAVRYLEIDCVTGEIATPLDSRFRVTLSELAGGSGIVDVEVPTLLPELEPGFSRRLFAVRPGPDSPAVAYAEWAIDAPDDATYAVIELDGNSATGGGASTRTSHLGRSGARVGYTAAANYIAGLAFEHPSRRRAVIRASTDGETETVARLILTDDGYATEVLHRQPTGTGRLIRPYAPLNGGPLAAVATEITSYGGYTSFAGNLKGILDGGRSGDVGYP